MSRLNRMDGSSVPRKTLLARDSNGHGVEGALASDALPLPMALTNKFFFLLFIAATVFLLHRWDEKKKKQKWNTMSSSMMSPRGATHALTLPDLIALLAIVASLVYLWGFFGIVYVQNLITTTRTSFSEEDLERRGDEGEVNLDGQVFANGQDIIRANPAIGQAFCVHETSSDEDIALAVNAGLLPIHSLETKLGPDRAAVVRNRAVEIMTGRSLRGLALRSSGFDYSSVLGQCCEMVIGHVNIPVGVAGPLLLDGHEYMVPMATTEGCLVASTNRGCKAILLSGGATSILLKDGMTRAPLVRFTTALRAHELKSFLEQPDNFERLATAFNRTSRFARLQSIQCSLAGRNLYIRFVCSTGDAMGMNMISKGVQNVLHYLEEMFPDMEVLSISGNMCADKKATAVNWIQGRGKSVVCEAIIKEDVVAKVLKTSVPDLIELNVLKNLVGSSIAGAIGGFNAHASNIVTALFIATGQDPAQNVESSQCITLMEPTNNGRDLYISVTMPTLEVGTIGGGTQLAAQSACLNLLGVKGSNVDCPGANAQCLARIIGGAVLAGELSLMSALAAGHLVKSHMKYNRSNKNTHNVQLSCRNEEKLKF